MHSTTKSGFTWLLSTLQDLRFGTRLLRKNPWVAALVISSMAVGIGGNTAVLTVLNGILLRTPSLYDQPEQLLWLAETPIRQPEALRRSSAMTYRTWKESIELVDGFAAAGLPSTVNVRINDYPIGLTSQLISADLLPLLGVQPALGRNFSTEEDQPGGKTVALLSHRAWQQRFNGQVEAIGREVHVNGVSHTIVGVLPERFWFHTPGTHLWLPLRVNPADHDMANRSLFVVARKRVEVSSKQLERTAETVLRNLEQQLLPEDERGRGVRSVPLVGRHLFGAQAAGAIQLLLAAIGLILLVVCVNVGVVMAARGVARRSETAVRTALGASRLRLVRQFLAETLC